MANLSNINGKFVVEQTTGYVGVGTTDPSYPIEVLNASAEIALNASGGSTYRIQSDSASNFIIRKEGVGDRLVINSAGNSTFAGSITGTSANFSGIVYSSGGFRTGSTNSSYNLLTRNNGNGSYPLYCQNSLGVSGDAAIARFAYGSYGANTGTVILDIRSGTSYFNDCNVGIGTTSPSGKLHVSTGTDTSVGNIEFFIGGTNASNARSGKIIKNTSSPYEMTIRASNFTNGNNLILNDTGGNVGIGTVSPDALLELKNSAPEIRLTDSTDDSYTRLRYDGSAFLIEVDDASGANDSNFRIQVDGSERMRIDSSGNSTFKGNIEVIDPVSSNFSGEIKIGGTGSSRRLVLKQDTVLEYLIGASGSGTILKFGSGNGATERMRIDSSGVIQVRNQTPTIQLYNTDTSVAAAQELGSIDFYTSDISAPRVSSFITSKFNSAFGDSYLSFGTSTGVGAATERMRIDSSGTIISTINDSTAATFKHIKLGGGTGVNGNGQYIQFSSSSNAALGSRIEGTREAAGGSSNLKIYTTNTGGSVTERMRITSAGAIEVRNGSIICGEVKNSGADNDFTLNGQRGQVIFEIAGSQAYVMDSQQIYPTADNARNLGTASSRFSVVYSANGVSTSDETLKENIKECDLGIDFIDSLKPKSYNLKDLKEDNDAYGKKRYGLIAQDILETELKDSVFGKKDGEYGLSYNDLIAPMIKAIQELKADNDSLKARIETLENN